MSWVVDVFLIMFFVFLNGFFVLAEFALVKVRKSQIKLLAEDGGILAKYAFRVVKDLNNYLSACQLGITIASIALGWIGEPAITKMLGPLLLYFGFSESVIHWISFSVGFVIITGLHIVLGELVPKSLAILESEKFAVRTAMPLALFYKATYPVMYFFNYTTNCLLKLMGYSITNEHGVIHTDEEIKLLIKESYKHGLLGQSEFTYVDNILDFKERAIKDVMVPRVDAVCVAKNDALADLITLTIKEKFTRYPVYESNKDSIIGFVHVRDLYELKIMGKSFNINDLIRPIVTVYENTLVSEVLKTFQKEKANIALVVDEYGGTAGIVTLEDVLEEIVGELNDEYDDEEKEIVEIDKNSFLVKGIVSLSKIADLTGVLLPEEEFDTLSGFLISKIGRIPNVDEKPLISYKNIDFQVEKVGKRRILKVKIKINNLREV